MPKPVEELVGGNNLVDDATQGQKTVDDATEGQKTVDDATANEEPINDVRKARSSSQNDKEDLKPKKFKGKKWKKGTNRKKGFTKPKSVFDD